MVHIDNGTGRAQRLVLRQLLHGQDGSAGNVVFVEDLHGLEFAFRGRPLLDASENFIEARQARRWLGVVGMRLPARLTGHIADGLPHGRLCDEVDVGVGIGLPAFAFEDASGLAAAGIVARARHRIAEGNAFSVLAVLGERPVREALLIAHLHARQVEHAVLHGAGDALSTAGRGAMKERGDDAERQMQAGTAVSDLCAGNERRPVSEAGRRRRAAGALGHVLINLAVLVRPGSETFHGGIDHAWIEFLDALPGKAHAIECPGCEILHEHIAPFHQALEDLHALLVFAVDRDRALVMVQHGEIERIGSLQVHQLAARDVAHTWPLHLDYVRTKPGEQLRAGRPRLHVREIENADAFECLAHAMLHYFFFTTLCGLRLPMRPLSLPAAGSITALMRVGLPESNALSTARFSSSGVVTLTPTPPNAAIILS